MAGGATLAGPPGECCFRAVKHVGEPRGAVETIAGVETYVTAPHGGSGDKIVLFFSDIFGAMFVNNKLLMDYWADNGYVVLALDYFHGDSYAHHVDKPDFDVWAWIQKMQARAPPLIPPWVDAVRARYGADKKYVCVGYCFGAPYVMEHVQKDWISAGALAHPAFLNEDHFRDATRPIMLSCAETDVTFPLESRRRAEDILAERKATYFIQIFGSVQHGFATRGNMDVPAERWAKEESARGFLNWFNHFTA